MENRIPNKQEQIAGELEKVPGLGKLFRQLYEIALHEYPSISKLDIEVSNSDKYPLLKNTGGFARHQGINNTGRPSVVINGKAGIEHFARLMNNRKESAKMCADILEVDISELTPEILAGFIMLHEMGHSFNNLNNYPDYNEYQKIRDEEMKSLPIAGWDPSDARSSFEDNNSNLSKWYEINKKGFESMGYKTKWEVFEAHERAYHNLETEKFPDFFAKSILKRNWEKLGSGKKEKARELDVNGIIKSIEEHLDEQPRSVQMAWSEVKNKLVRAVDFGDKTFVFTNISFGLRGNIYALEKDNDKKIWKTRIFRFSGSDHQWKSYPGKEDGRSMKGDESNPMHHYVQSAKLHKEIYKIIESLPKINEEVQYSKFLPHMHKNSKYLVDEFEFKEYYLDLKNPEWSKFQKWAQLLFRSYDYIIGDERDRHDYGKESSFYKFLLKGSSIPEIKNIIEAIDRVSSVDSNHKYILGTYSINIMEDMNHSPEIQKFAEVYYKNIGNYFERAFKVKMPDSMIPTFDISEKVDSYEKNDFRTKNKIYIEEYKAKSPEGDELVYAMAYDTKGRVYIDNIYDSRVGMNSYGVVSKITQIGYLVYKPEDYGFQTWGIPKKYVKDAGNGYKDISAFWENIPVIKKYKEELIRRGILK